MLTIMNNFDIISKLISKTVTDRHVRNYLFQYAVLTVLEPMPKAAMSVAAVTVMATPAFFIVNPILSGMSVFRSSSLRFFKA